MTDERTNECSRETAVMCRSAGTNRVETMRPTEPNASSSTGWDQADEQLEVM